MKFIKIIIAILLVYQTTDLIGQTVFMEDYEITRMMDHFANENKSTFKISGWRIQLVATTDRRKMEDLQREFMSKYPEITVDWIHAKPYYKLKAGAFATKSEALPVLHRIKKDFPGAFPAKDHSIRPRELVGL